MNRFILLLLGIMLSASVFAQEQTAIQLFENSGFSYSASYQSAHADGVRFRSVALSAGYKFNSKVFLGAVVQPSVITTPDVRKEDRYFTVDANGDFNFVEEKLITKEGKSYFSLPVAVLTRVYFTGDRRNSPLLEVAFGRDCSLQTLYLSYMLGARMGFGASNRNAFLMSAGVIVTDPDVDHLFDSNLHLAVKFGFEF